MTAHTALSIAMITDAILLIPARVGCHSLITERVDFRMGERQGTEFSGSYSTLELVGKKGQVACSPKFAQDDGMRERDEMVLIDKFHGW